MGLLYAVSETNREILSTEQLRYGKYIIDFELVAYDRTERLLWITHAEPMVSINVRAFTPDTEICEYADQDGYHRLPISTDCMATERLAWPKDNGQDNWPVQLEGAVESVLQELTEDTDDEPTMEDQFTEAIETYRQEELQA